MTDSIARMQQAKQLLEDPLLNEAFAAIDQQIIDRLRAKASPNDADLLMALRVIGQIRGWLKTQVESGKVELFEQEMKARKEKPNG